MRNRWWAASGAAAAVVCLAACGSSAASGTGSSSPSSSTPAASSTAGGAASSNSAAGIKTASVKGGTVLTTAQGFTIYWFAIDGPNKSNCSGTCVTFWPPVTGTPSAASGVNLPGKLGMITRADGTTQATYNGRPLYTYKADTSPGQVGGNGINTSGGLWWAETPSGTKLTSAPAPSPTGSGGGGYGY